MKLIGVMAQLAFEGQLLELGFVDVRVLFFSRRVCFVNVCYADAHVLVATRVVSGAVGGRSALVRVKPKLDRQH